MTTLFLWHGGLRVRALQLALAAAAGATTLLVGLDHWVGSWKVALDWGTGSLALIAPVSAGIAALVTSTMTTRGWDALTGGMRRGWVGLLGPVVGAWLVGLLGMLLTTGVAVVTAGALGASASPGMLGALPLVSVTLAGEVAIGAVIGTMLAPVVAAPVATVSVFLLVSLSHGGTLPGIFRTGGVTGSLAGETYDYTVLLLTAGVCGSLAGTCMLALAWHAIPVRRRVTFALFALCLAPAVPAWWALETKGHERYALETDPGLLCRGHSPQVCLSDDTVRPLPSLAAELQRQAAVLSALGVAVPERFVAELPGAPSTDDGVILFVGDEAMSASVSPRTVSLALATPRHCPQYSAAEAPVRALQVRAFLTDWIATHSGSTARTGSPTSPAGRWLRLPVAQQAPWVVETYAALTDCRLADVRLPFRP